uniref:Peptidase_M1 domain-containing protein n=1 Tax=Macrostomum lignano TaxID=282301 RepID=A0A1I8IZC5_9PLAT
STSVCISCCSSFFFRLLCFWSRSSAGIEPRTAAFDTTKASGREFNECMLGLARGSASCSSRSEATHSSADCGTWLPGSAACLSADWLAHTICHSRIIDEPEIRSPLEEALANSAAPFAPKKIDDAAAAADLKQTEKQLFDTSAIPTQRPHRLDSSAAAAVSAAEQCGGPGAPDAPLKARSSCCWCRCLSETSFLLVAAESVVADSARGFSPLLGDFCSPLPRLRRCLGRLSSSTRGGQLAERAAGGTGQIGSGGAAGVQMKVAVAEICGHRLLIAFCSAFAPDVRLPTEVKPLRYNVTLSPYIYGSNAPEFHFTGSMKVRLSIENSTSNIRVYDSCLDINCSGSQCYSIDLDEPLPANSTDIVIDPNGTTKYLATSHSCNRLTQETNFRVPTSRHSRPCRFDLSLVRRPDFIAISSMPAIRTRNATDSTWFSEMSDSEQEDFETTPIVSAYLLTYIVSQFEPMNTREAKISKLGSTRGLNRTEYDQFNRISIAVLILKCMMGILASHEAANMWFGSLVTPEWWNSLWLSEGFALFFGLTRQYSESTNKSLDVGSVMDRWIKQMGYPVLNCSVTAAGRLTLTQNHFLSDSSQVPSYPSDYNYTWIIPVTMGTKQNLTSGTPEDVSGFVNWMAEKEQAFELDSSAD